MSRSGKRKCRQCKSLNERSLTVSLVKLLVGGATLRSKKVKSLRVTCHSALPWHLPRQWRLSLLVKTGGLPLRGKGAVVPVSRYFSIARWTVVFARHLRVRSTARPTAKQLITAPSCSAIAGILPVRARNFNTSIESNDEMMQEGCKTVHKRECFVTFSASASLQMSAPGMVHFCFSPETDALY